jgi:hypothetical protein
MNIKILSLLLLLIITLTGCFGTAKRIGYDDRFHEVVNTIPEIKEGKSRIFIYYPDSPSLPIFGSLAIDNQVVQFDSGTFSYIDIDAGVHSLSFAEAIKVGYKFPKAQFKWTKTGEPITFNSGNKEIFSVKVMTQSVMKKTVSFDIYEGINEKEINDLYFAGEVSKSYINKKIVIGDIF